MKLKKFKIEGFRRIIESEIIFGDATFIIGENNVGKSAVLKALDIFLSGQQKLDDEDFFFDESSGIKKETIIFTAEFDDLPEQAQTWHGFRGRVLKREKPDGTDRFIIYRKTYQKGVEFVPEMKVYNKSLKNQFKGCKKVQDFIDSGISIDIINAIFTDVDNSTNLTTKANSSKLEYIEELWDINETEIEWEKNPGGIQGNITIRLPRFLMIPAEDRMGDIEDKTGALQKTMSELFKEVRDASENYKKAQEYLNNLAKELDPKDNEKDFGKMLSEINKIVGNVFPDSCLHVETQLDDADKVLNPKFQIEMSSNVKTKPERQGTGSVRSAAFALLRYREQFLEKRRIRDGDDVYIRSLIIGYEEPEIYLHPNAANNMRDEIYNLAVSSTSQIVCTTHSPYMIDLSKDLDKEHYPRQILNLFKLKIEEGEKPYFSAKGDAFNVTDAYKNLIEEEQDYIKLILKLDDYVARVFFAKSVIIVEGDTEDIIFKETIKRLPEKVRKQVQSNYQIIKARGKAAIIAVIKYMKSMGISPFVIHDKDLLEGAIKFNHPIKEAIGNDDHLFVCDHCIEKELGYDPPSKDKPYAAYKFIKDNWAIEKGWEGVSLKWRKIIEEKIFNTDFRV